MPNGQHKTSKQRSVVIAAILLVSLVTPHEAYAWNDPVPTADVEEPGSAAQLGTGSSGSELLNVHVKWELPISAIGGALSEIIGDRFSPSSCSWCTPDGFDERVGSHLVWERHTSLANALSWLTGFVGPPLLPFVTGQHVDRERLGQDFALMAETWALNDAVNQVIKHIVARRRPFAHRDPSVTSTGANVSFYSGHTSGSFAIVMALYRAHRIRQDPDAGRLLAIGLPLAAATGYLRIAADKHWATDVFTGAAVGSAFGALIPELHARGSPVSIQPVASPASLAIYISLAPR